MLLTCYILVELEIHPAKKMNYEKSKTPLNCSFYSDRFI